jgi:hypothetical protein
LQKSLLLLVHIEQTIKLCHPKILGYQEVLVKKEHLEHLRTEEAHSQGDHFVEKADAKKSLIEKPASYWTGPGEYAARESGHKRHLGVLE